MVRAATDGPLQTRIAAAAWRARWAILGAAIIAGLGGYLISSQQDASYSAHSRMVLSAAQPFDPLGRQSFGDETRYLANQVDITQSTPVLQRAADSLPGTSLTQLAEAVSVSGDDTSDLVVVTAEGPTPRGAAARADAVVAAYRSYVGEQVAAAAQRATAATRDATVIDQIRTEAAVYGDGVAVVEPAAAPDGTSSPRPTRDALVLAAIAALVAFVIAAARRQRSPLPERVRAAVAAPLLDTVVVRPVRDGEELRPGDGDFAVASVALDYARSRTGGPVLLTGTGRGSDTAVVAHGLALAEAARGRRVLLVDGDATGRGLARTGAPRPTSPLGAAARPSTPDAEVFVPVPGGDGRLELAVVSLPGAAEAVDERELRAALTAVADRFDVVLLQAGPVTEDAAAFAQVLVAGAVVLVAAAGDSEQSIRTAGDRVVAAGAPLIGVIATRTGRRVPKETPAPTAAPTGSPAVRAPREPELTPESR